MSRSPIFKDVKTSRKRQKQLGMLVRYLIALILIAFALFPIIWILSASLNPTDTLGSRSLIPENAGLQNYEKLLTDNPFSEINPYKTWLLNSIKISSITTIFSVSITTLAAYAFSRFRFRPRESMLRGILLVQVFPSLLAMVAVFLLVQQLGKVIPALGLDTHTGLILVYLGGAMGINIWLMKGFFDSIPREIDESAMVDGATHWQIFSRLLLPLMRPIIVVVSILTFIFVYGDFVVASVLLDSKTQWPLTVGLVEFTSNQFAQQWGVFAAGALIGALPIMIVYILLQDQIVGGLTQGSVKG
jgi:ABC-type maltose transport system permease subunit